jgi:Cu-processing system ATP-binding protein
MNLVPNLNLVEQRPLKSIGAMVNIIGLRKQFGRLQVLKDLDCHIDRGKVTAVIGPNGSGKTTLIKIILGLTRPDAGKVIVDGIELDGGCAYRSKIGYMPQMAHFPDNLSAMEVINMVQDLRGNPQRQDQELMDAFALSNELHKPLRTLSGGNRQKVSAVLAFLFDPQVLILDEPTAGLDPVASSVLKDKIQQEKEAGKTFVLTSHIMSEVEELADTIAYLHEGRIQFMGSIKELKQSVGQARLERAIARIMQGAAL